MSGSPKSQTVTQTTEIPDFLKPYITQQMQAGQQSLGNLSNLLTGAGAEQLVAPFSQPTIQAQNAVMEGMSPTGFLGSSLGTFGNIATQSGQQAQASIDELMRRIGVGMPGGGGGGSFGGGYMSVPSAGAGGGSFQLDQIPRQALEGIAQSGFQLNPVAQQALERSAAGEYMYGSPGFDEAVQASIRAAQPVMASTFGGMGSGGLKSGLAQIGMQQAASDSFARLFGDERARQIGSASTLGQFGLAGQGNQLSAAGQLGNMQLTARGQDVTSAGQQLAAAMQGQSINAQREMNNLGLLAQLANQGANREMLAAQMIPNIGLLGVSALGDIGAQQQAQAQQELMAPITAAMMLQQASAGIPLGQLLGSTSTQPFFRNTGAGMLGGAATGAQIGNMVGGPVGAGIGAIGGGLLGGFF